MIPKVHIETVNSIVEEVFTKNKSIGVKEFDSEQMLTINQDMAISIFSLMESIADNFSTSKQSNEELCCIAKIAAHLTYKSIETPLEINAMEDGP